MAAIGLVLLGVVPAAIGDEQSTGWPSLIELALNSDEPRRYVHLMELRAKDLGHVAERLGVELDEVGDDWRRRSAILWTLFALQEHAAPARDAVGRAVRVNEPHEGENLPIRTLVRMGPAGVGPLVEILRSERGELRDRVIGALGRIGSDSVPPLLELLDEATPPLRWDVLGALAWLGVDAARAASAVVPLIGDTEATTRYLATWALGRFGSATVEVREALREAASDADVDVRAAAIVALGTLAPNEEKDLLLKAVKDPDWRVRWVAAGALGRAVQSGDGTEPALLSAMSDDVAAVRWAAATALGRLGARTPATLDALTRALEDPSPMVTWGAAGALGRLGGGVDALAGLLSGDTPWTLKWLCIQGLCGQEGAAEALLAVAEKAEAEDVRLIAYALGELGVGSPQALDWLKRQFDEPDRVVRLLAAEALGRGGTGGGQIDSVLDLALEDADVEVRATALWALRLTDKSPPARIERVTAMLKDEAWPVRWAAVVALGRMGTAGHTAADAIAERLYDDSEIVRDRARWALLQVLGKEGASSVLAEKSVGGWDVTWAHIGPEPPLPGRWVPVVPWRSPEPERTLREDIEALRDEDGEDVKKALSHLEELGPHAAQAADAVAEYIDGVDYRDEREALEVLASIGRPAVRPILRRLRALKLRDLTDGERLLDCLGKMGQDAQEAAPTLRVILGTALEAEDPLGSSFLRFAGGPKLVAVLAGLGDSSDETLDVLMLALESPGSRWARKNDRMRPAVFRAFGRLGRARDDVVEACRKALQDDDSQVARAAAEAIVALLDSPDAATALLDGFEYGNGLSLAATLEGLTALDETATRVLRRRMEDGNEGGVLAATLALRARGEPQADESELLLDHLLNDDDDVRTALHAALAVIGRDGTEALMAVRDAEEGAALAVLQAFLEIGADPELSGPWLLDCLKHDDQELREAAAAVIAMMGPPSAAAGPALQTALEDESEAVRRDAAVALDLIKASDTTGAEDEPRGGPPHGLLGLVDIPMGARAKAFRAIGEQRGAARGRYQELVAALTDETDEVRVEAARALGKIRAPRPEVLDALLKATRDDNSDLAEAAMEALAPYGPFARRAACELLVRTRTDRRGNDDDYGVSLNAVKSVIYGLHPGGLELVPMLLEAQLAGEGDLGRHSFEKRLLLLFGKGLGLLDDLILYHHLHGIPYPWGLEVNPREVANLGDFILPRTRNSLRRAGWDTMRTVSRAFGSFESSSAGADHIAENALRRSDAGLALEVAGSMREDSIALIQELEGMARGSSPILRRRALYCLLGCGDEGVGAVQRLFGDGGPLLRMLILDVLFDEDEHRAVALSLAKKAVGDPISDVAARAAAILSIEGEADADTEQVVIDSLGVPGTSGLTFSALVLRGEASVDPMREVLRQEDSPRRSDALRVLGALAPVAHEAVPEVAALLGYPDPLGELASDFLGYVGDAAHPALRRLLSGRDPHAKRSALALLWTMDDSAHVTIESLSELLASSDPELRAGGFAFIGRLPPESAGPFLSALVEEIEKAGRAREEARRALGSLGPAVAPVLPQMRTWLQGGAWHRGIALDLVADWGPDAAELLPEVLRLADEEHPDHYAALRAIMAMGPAAKEAIPPLLRNMRKAKYLKHYGKSVVETLGTVGPEAWPAIAPGTKVLDMVAGEYARKDLVKALRMLRMR